VVLVKDGMVAQGVMGRFVLFGVDGCTGSTMVESSFFQRQCLGWMKHAMDYICTVKLGRMGYNEGSSTPEDFMETCRMRFWCLLTFLVNGLPSLRSSLYFFPCS
jgi:hypothetical protein